MSLSFGSKASKSGGDVLTALDKDLAFSTKYPILKILLKGDTSLTTDGSGNGSVSISHNLGFAPAFYIFRKGSAYFLSLDANTYNNVYFPDPEIESLWILGSFICYTTTDDLIISASGQTPNTTYNFHYLLFIDLAETYTGDAGVSLINDYGLKVSPDNIDVLKAKEYQLVYSQKYKSLQYYDVNYKVGTLTLPKMNANIPSSGSDNTIEEGTYVDINHGLGYPPFFLVYIKYGTLNYLIPYRHWSGNVIYSLFDTYFIAWCDSTRVRITFFRQDKATTSYPDGWNQFSETTITYKCFVFTEDLSN